MASTTSPEERISRLHRKRLIDLHFDLPLGLFLNRSRRNQLATNFLPEFEADVAGFEFRKEIGRELITPTAIEEKSKWQIEMEVDQSFSMKTRNSFFRRSGRSHGLPNDLRWMIVAVN